MLKSLEDIELCESFYPTHKEFENFAEYLEKITKMAKGGIFKVVPPKGWRARKDDYMNLDFSIPHPIEQIVSGKDGFYELLLMQRESRLLSKYKKLVEPFDKITEGKKMIDIEKLFWKTLKFSAPLYGADSPGSLFDKGVPWNLSELDTPLRRGLKGDITGVTTPYLYFGSWKTMFAWHKEDLDLHAINFLHFGKPKFWYGLKQEDDKKFTEFAAKHFEEAYRECPEFMRHKTYLIHPSILVENGFKLNKCIQLPGEFVITKSAGYHAGFNLGFNCAEAVNFALGAWAEKGKTAGICKCRNDSVKIDMNVYADNLRIKKGKKKEENINEKNTTTNHFIKRQAKRDAISKNIKNKGNSDKIKPKKNNKLKIKKTSTNNTIENWLSCDNCNKWRKIPKITKNNLKKFENTGFTCNLIKNVNCNSIEEKWRTKYTTLKRKNHREILSKTKLKNVYKNLKKSLKD